MTSTFSNLFIVTYGRTGSTLLQGILNRYPEVRVNGENHGSLYYLYRARRALENSIIAPDEDTPMNAFFGGSLVPSSDLLESIDNASRSLVRLGATHERLTGFKEIRFDLPDLYSYIAYILKLFPKSLFVFLTRPISEVLESGFWKNTTVPDITAKIRYMEAEFASLSSDFPGHTISIDYHDILECSAKFKSIFQLLELQFDEEKFLSSMSSSHSYATTSTIFFKDTSISMRPHEYLDRHFVQFRFDPPQLRGSQSLLSGVLLPRDDKAQLHRISSVRVTSEAEVLCTEARVGLPSPGVAAKHADHPSAGNARFSLPLPHTPGCYRIEVELGGNAIALGNMFVGEPGPSREFFQLPLRAR
jgi:hypothetical protein